ncbi:hypothetical protein MTR67_016820 [Solanum verrucosum]|uniref:Btz domain-containing protein n=1 Tax=Solanum verrucosum TaxID=315347 RepID=A0AAF0QJD2_SOLVR|nr:hypothetical protein MTR67_016820 [Solanum verrucosum]
MSPISLSSWQNAETPVYLRDERKNIQDVRDGFQDHSFGSSRGNFMRGRGRGRGWGWGRGRFHRLSRDWYSGRDFESYRGVADYRFRHNRTAAVWDSRLDGVSFASNRRRNPDALHSFRHPSAPPVRSRTQYRSPIMYREDRMRSSPQTSFTEEAIAPQRRDYISPSYTARRLNDMRDVDAVQEHGHPRSLSSRRSPPDQVFTGTNRPRVEILDHQERADGRFPELHSGESTDKKRKYREGRREATQMKNVEDESDVSRLKKRRF